MQKSTREGFGLTVTEGLWKARPTIGGDVGGIPLQIEDGVSGSPVTIHSAPEVKTCRCRPEKTARIAFTWSETSANSIASSSRPVPASKSPRSPVRDSHSRFGASRDPPSTRRFWWKQAQTGQPRTRLKAASCQSSVGSVSSSGSSTTAVAFCGPSTEAITTRCPFRRKRREMWPSPNTGAELTSATVPVVADAAIVTSRVKLWKTSRPKTKGVMLQAMWLLRVRRCGGISGWNSSSVSALWVKDSCGSMAVDQGAGRLATSASPRNTCRRPWVSTSR
ncbi:hypothetical protein [Falsiroseomonas sp.]|uniref:hypothetical protein n=1 Tax=Falsiroseomonas sp. TaxID=2870721 RepID=UPI00351F243D